MSPIVDLQARMRELGRIRTGVQVPGSRGPRPSKLETFRLTSPQKELIEAAAAAYGGVVSAWGEGEWEVVTTAATLDIMVPPGEPLSQWYELWSGGGCQRRCDGKLMILGDEPVPCLCPADADERRRQASLPVPTACKPTTRLNVMLTAIPDLGVWRLESHGYYAAVELAGAADVLAYASNRGRPLAARLRLDQRTKKVPGQPINRYAVPVIEFVDVRIADLISAGADPDRPMLGPGGRRTPIEGPEVELEPSTSFRAPLPADDTLGPEDAARFAAAAGAGLSVPPEEPPPAPGGDVGLTQAELIAKLNESHVSLAYAIESAKKVFPDRPADVALTPAQRLTLWRFIEAENAASAL